MGGAGDGWPSREWSTLVGCGLPLFARASVDYLTRQFTPEITVGIGDTGSRAGVIKGRGEPRWPHDGT